MKIGCIGLGGMGTGDAHDHNRYGDIVAVCDVDANHRERARNDEKIGKGKAESFEDYRKVLDNKEIEVVSIVTPDHWHTKIAIEALQSPGEPQTTAGRIARRDRMQYQGRLWATRRHLWVDRVASAWLIQRFIDPHARFQWLDSPTDCPSDALGFDFDGATFTHVGERVTFEVLLTSFGLESDRGLSRLAEIVHALDVGGTATPEASGFEAVLAGARKRWSDDDSLLADIGGVLDSLHAHFSSPRKT
jgi:hypothetical protein